MKRNTIHMEWPMISVPFLPTAVLKPFINPFCPNTKNMSDTHFNSLKLQTFLCHWIFLPARQRLFLVATYRDNTLLFSNSGKIGAVQIQLILNNSSLLSPKFPDTLFRNVSFLGFRLAMACWCTNSPIYVCIIIEHKNERKATFTPQITDVI